MGCGSSSKQLNNKKQQNQKQVPVKEQNEIPQISFGELQYHQSKFFKYIYSQLEEQAQNIIHELLKKDQTTSEDISQSHLTLKEQYEKLKMKYIQENLEKYSKSDPLAQIEKQIYEHSESDLSKEIQIFSIIFKDGMLAELIENVNTVFVNFEKHIIDNTVENNIFESINRTLLNKQITAQNLILIADDEKLQKTLFHQDFKGQLDLEMNDFCNNKNTQQASKIKSLLWYKLSVKIGQQYEKLSKLILHSKNITDCVGFNNRLTITLQSSILLNMNEKSVVGAQQNKSISDKFTHIPPNFNESLVNPNRQLSQAPWMIGENFKGNDFAKKILDQYPVNGLGYNTIDNNNNNKNQQIRQSQTTSQIFNDLDKMKHDFPSQKDILGGLDNLSNIKYTNASNMQGFSNNSDVKQLPQNNKSVSYNSVVYSSIYKKQDQSSHQETLSQIRFDLSDNKENQGSNYPESQFMRTASQNSKIFFDKDVKVEDGEQQQQSLSKSKSPMRMSERRSVKNETIKEEKENEDEEQEEDGNEQIDEYPKTNNNTNNESTNNANATGQFNSVQQNFTFYNAPQDNNGIRKPSKLSQTFGDQVKSVIVVDQNNQGNKNRSNHNDKSYNDQEILKEFNQQINPIIGEQKNTIYNQQLQDDMHLSKIAQNTVIQNQFSDYLKEYNNNNNNNKEHHYNYFYNNSPQFNQNLHQPTYQSPSLILQNLESALK